MVLYSKAIELAPPAVNAFFEVAEAAKKLDPEAFRPIMMPHYTDDQLIRQQRAMERARKALGKESSI